MARGVALAPALTLALLWAGCLPEDTRSPPGRLNVSVRGDEALVSGATTADGWTIAFERFLISLGEVDLEGDDCTRYNESDYLRIFDLRLGTLQTVSTPFARGRCGFGFRVAIPPENAVLGAGVTPADLVLFRTPGSDGFERDRGLVLLVSGTATDGSAAKRFEWHFRRGVQYSSCRLGDEAGVTLESHDDQSIELLVHSLALFRASPDVGDEFRFAPFAEADDAYGNGDGMVTLEELGAAPGPAGFASYAEYVYLDLAPGLPRYRGTGSCALGRIEDDEGP
jgi:hypothetical protein